MTFATLRALQTIIAQGLDDIEKVYADASASMPQQASGSPTPADYPSLDIPGDPSSRAEQLAAHPTVLVASSQVVSAACQLATVLRAPFLTLCDASLGHNLPACLRFLEATHIPELLRESGEDGMHVDAIGEKINVEASRTGHILRLLATQHILREVKPDAFSLNRVSALLDSGKTFSSLASNSGGIDKYEGQGQAAAFFALNTDELFKASAYMTDFLVPAQVAESLPTASLLDESTTALPHSETATLVAQQSLQHYDMLTPPATSNSLGRKRRLVRRFMSRFSSISSKSKSYVPCSASSVHDIPPSAHSRSPARQTQISQLNVDDDVPYQTAFNLALRTRTPYWAWLELPGNEKRLARFGRAMGGSAGWESAAMDALCGEPYPSLPPGSLVVDVGGGIGNATMRLAQQFPSLRFVVQDRAAVCRQGEEVWRTKMAQALDSERVRFQVHDFFEPQPASLGHIGAFLARVILHDWPDVEAAKILLRLRESASTDDASPTYLVIGDHILPYANTIEGQGTSPSSNSASESLAAIENAEEALCLSGASWPLLANLGMASSNAYWMDMTMQSIFNGRERTLPELVSLCASAGWKVVAANRVSGSTFGHIVAKPTVIPA